MRSIMYLFILKMIKLVFQIEIIWKKYYKKMNDKVESQYSTYVTTESIDFVIQINIIMGG